MIVSPVESGVDIILVQENLLPGVADADVSYVGPMLALSRDVNVLRNVDSVLFVHMVVGGTIVILSMDVCRGVNYDPPITLTEEETYGGEEEAIDELSYPPWIDKEKLIGAARYYLGEHG